MPDSDAVDLVERQVRAYQAFDLESTDGGVTWAALPAAGTDIRGVAWSPDGRRIAFAADLFEPEPTLEYRIATVGANGGPVRVHWKSRRFISALDWQPR